MICVIIIGKYDELAPNMGFPSIKSHLQEKPHEFKDRILKHLNNGTVHMVTASGIVDVLTGKRVNRELVHMNDGEYSWSSSIAYYVEKYNLELPEEFINHILEQ